MNTFSEAPVCGITTGKVKKQQNLMFMKKGDLKSFLNFTGKHLCWSFFLKSLQSEGLQIYWKSLFLERVFSCEVCEIF